MSEPRPRKFWSRRRVIQALGIGALGAAGLTLAYRPLVRRWRNQCLGHSVPEGLGYGPLKPDPQGLLDLPEGFSYRVILRMGDPMSGGGRIPGAPDGGGVFAMGDGSYRLIRNHELSAGQQDRGATTGNWRPEAAKVFDPHSLGGTTTTVLDRNLRTVRTFLSLAGTERNCAGGVTPWGSWLSCEESVKSPADDPSYRRAHGYVFEVHAAANGLEAAVPLKAMGRFVHEAAVVNPASGEVYQTEDRRNGCFYKFEPGRPGRLASGRLFALRVKGRPGLDTGNRRGNGAAAVAVGERLATDWVELGQPDSEGDTLRKEAGELGAATFVRGEGMVWGGGAAAFTATSGGPSGLGQVWRYAPQSGGGGQLTLLAEAAEKCDFFMPDNIAVQPGGELILAEDNREFTRLIGLNSQGRAYPFAYFRPGASEEFSGLAFPPDGRFMVASLYEMGLTLLVTGPFRPTR